MPRKEVQWFAEHMESRLKANDHKGGWNDMFFEDLIVRLKEELAELKAAKNSREVITECADVANFAMMIADNREKQWGYEQHDAAEKEG